MNQLNESYQSANQTLINQVLAATLAEQPVLIKACQCHFIDPQKLRMLLWKDLKDGQETYILKIAEQKFVGEARSDRRGETYWRFRELYEDRGAKPTDVLQPKKLSQTKPPAQLEIEINQPLSDSSAQTDRLTKFQERQAKVQELQKETKWINGNEVLAQLAQEKAERKAQLASEPIPENAN